ncbi:dihydroxy-acid dehydratase domain-containing protein [Cupriavidus basilensis]
MIGIVNTNSSYNPCHGNAPQLVEAVKRGVMLAGGLPVDFPTISVHESFSAPTSMYLRNLMSMDTEEMIRAQPMDAVVLIGGCDKTVPAQLMGAASAGVPAIQLVTGSMLTGSHRGERVGACTDCRRYWGRYRAEEIDAAEIADVNNQLVASVGTCSVMGTASTMACLTEALGMMVAGGAPRRRRSQPTACGWPTRTGTTAVAMAPRRPDAGPHPYRQGHRERHPRAAGHRRVTNGIVHLTAIAGRLGIDIDLAGLDRMSRETPVLVDLKPLRPALHGRLPRGRRHAGAAARAASAAASRHAHRIRPYAGRGA